MQRLTMVGKGSNTSQRQAIATQTNFWESLVWVPQCMLTAYCNRTSAATGACSEVLIPSYELKSSTPFTTWQIRQQSTTLLTTTLVE